MEASLALLLIPIHIFPFSHGHKNFKKYKVFIYMYISLYIYKWAWVHTFKVVPILSEEQGEISFYCKQYLSTIEMGLAAHWEDKFPDFNLTSSISTKHIGI